MSILRSISMKDAFASGATAEAFGDSYLIRLNTADLRVEMLSRGAALNSVKVRNPNAVPGSSEEWVETCLGYTTPAEALHHDAVTGQTVGRVAGRIAHGIFKLGKETYALAQNCGGHNLHGGPVGFQFKEWAFVLSDTANETRVAFQLLSPHLDQGFPGELLVTATYSIVKTASEPTLQYQLEAALTDNTPVDQTVLNLTNHVYWNLNGVPRPTSADAVAPLPKDVTNHYLQLRSTCIVATDDDLIPNGKMRPVAGTPHDYAKWRCIAPGMKAMESKSRVGGGYDDPIALAKWDATLQEAAQLYSPSTKLRMRIVTTNPSIVIYTANGLPANASGAKGERYQQHSAICMECQYYPNSPNVPAFPSTTLKKGDKYSETTRHEFQFMAHDPTAEPPAHHL